VKFRRLIAEACLPAVLGFALTLLLMRGFGWATVFAIAATITSQGGLLIGEFAAASGLPRLPYADRLRRGLYILIPLGATSIVAILVLIYVGLSGEASPSEFFIGPAIVVGLMLGASILLAPALVLGADAEGVLGAAVRSVWRLVVAVILGVLYVAAIIGGVWLFPDQLVERGIVPDSEIALIRAAVGWFVLALVATPFWWLVMHLYIEPSRTRSAANDIFR